MRIKKNNQISGLCIIALVLQNISIFFSDIVHYITLIQIICLILYLFYMILNRVNIRLYKALSIWGVYLLIVFFNTIIGGDSKFVLSFLIINTVMMLNLSIEGIGIFEYNIVKLFSGFHFLCSMVVYFLPHSLYDGMFSVLLGENAYVNYSWRVISNMNAGITTQPGTNAIFLVLLMMICAIEIIEKKRKLYILLFFLSFLMIATTGKRSAIVITLLVIGIYYFYIIKNRAITNTGMLKGIFILLVVIVFGVWFVNNSTAIQTLIIKANELAKRGDVSNGRFELWKYAIDKWYQHPVLGVGLKKIQSLVGLDVHNTYIQILAETGFIGFIIFIIAIVCICCWAYKIVKNDMTTCTVASRCTIELGFMMVIYLLLYGFVGNTFIDYLPIMLFSVAIVMNFNGKEKLT